MERLWTPWRYSYISGATPAARKGVPPELAAWPGNPETDPGCVFCNLIQSVQWGIDQAGGLGSSAAKAGLVITRLKHNFVCLNAYPYSSGHLLVVPYRHVDSLAKLDTDEAHELMDAAQRFEHVLRAVYQPDGINLGLNLGAAAGAGVAEHLHLHMVPRWSGDTNFMTVTADTRVLPELLSVTWERLRQQLLDLSDI